MNKKYNLVLFEKHIKEIQNALEKTQSSIRLIDFIAVQVSLQDINLESERLNNIFDKYNSEYEQYNGTH